MDLELYRVTRDYEAISNSQAVVVFKDFVRKGRKFGFPVVATVADGDHEAQLEHAAFLLLEISGVACRGDVSGKLDLDPRSQLFKDAELLVFSARSKKSL